MIKKQTKIWTTKAGIKIRICDMEDSHLINAIKLITRRAKIVKEMAIYNAYEMLEIINGEEAQYQINNDILRLEMADEDEDEDIFDDFIMRICSIYKNLILEAKRRKLEYDT